MAVLDKEANMSCYFRHMDEILKEAGLKVTPENKKQIDRAFHDIVGTTYKDCPATWKEIKAKFLSDPQKRKELVNKLRAASG
jgi:DNA-binding transcriptional regulator YbjK